MMTALEHPLVQDYLGRLREEAHRLPVDEAYDLETQIREHLSAALGQDPSEVRVRETLDRLGQPAVVVGAATGVDQDAPPQPAVGAPRPGPDGSWREVGALVGLVGAALLFWVPLVNVVLWLGGLVLLVLSRRWSAVDKAWAALVLGVGPWLLVLVGSVAWVTGTVEECVSDEAGVVTCTGGGDAGLVTPVVVWAVIIAYLVLYGWTLVRLVRSAARA